MLEGADDCVAILCVGDLDADPCAGVGIDHQLKVEAMLLFVYDDLDLGAVPDPLGAREEGLEGAAQCLLVLPRGLVEPVAGDVDAAV